MKRDEKRMEIDRQIARISMISTPGPILLGLGLLGKFGEPEAVPFEFLQDASTVDGMLVIGGVIFVASSIATLKLALKKTAGARTQNVDP
jgi:hypothetical protein